MTSHEIKEFRSKIDNLIEKRRLGDAFETLRNAVKAISSWSVTDRIEKAEQSYLKLRENLFKIVAFKHTKN